MHGHELPGSIIEWLGSIGYLRPQSGISDEDIERLQRNNPEQPPRPIQPAHSPALWPCGVVSLHPCPRAMDAVREARWYDRPQLLHPWFDPMCQSNIAGLPD